VGGEQILGIIGAVLGTIGGTSLVKHGLTKVVNWGRGEWFKLPPVAKKLLPLVVGVLVAVTTGQEITDTLPAGSLDDGALIGLLASLFFRGSKPSKSVPVPEG
jgi:hypothetical protein|tara:strand:- start:7261 stop:7569 length:309 start_codon:yes stop_codon:yes gene_type:complete